MLMGLLISIVNASNHTKCVLLSNQCMTQPTLINFHPKSYSQDFHYHLFVNWKHFQSIHHANLNVNLMEESLIQINSGITINVDVSARNVIHMKKIVFGNLSLCNCKNGKYLTSIMDY